MAWRRHRDPGPAPAWVTTYTETDWDGGITEWEAARGEWLAGHPAHGYRELRECVEACGGKMSDFGLA